jgi:hypothetical protein|mmetsp:Transcript_119822/g.187932  ORF Transcript_119822/g.187932 Transcript_119822/m.187932 type:complete len:306 (-) Transcript_119822:82-999(-)
MASQGLMFALAGLSLLADGARISVRSQVDSSSGSVKEIGPEEETWETGTKYVCMQKWQNPGWASSEGKFVDRFCLAKYEEAKKAANFQAAQDMSRCYSSSSGKIRVCPFKGEGAERRVSYSSRVAVPLSCFRVSDVSGYSAVEVALDEDACGAAANLPAEQQGIQPKLTTTTTTTVTTTTTTTVEEQVEIIEDHFAEPEADVEIECKALFTDEAEDFTWNYGEAAFKCCTSSQGKGTRLQDMNADELPSARSFGTPSGCGRMFGDTYHNGLKRYKGADPSCLVPTSVLKKITGDDFDNIKAFLES